MCKANLVSPSIVMGIHKVQEISLSEVFISFDLHKKDH